MKNLFYGNKVLNELQMERGYAPSLFGTPSTAVLQDLLETHIETTAIQKLQSAKEKRQWSRTDIYIKQRGPGLGVYKIFATKYSGCLDRGTGYKGTGTLT